MASSKIWFAKLSNRGVGNPRMTPVSREGWLVVGGFVAAMLIGAILFATLMAMGAVALGVSAFAVFAVIGAGGFLWASVARGDKTRTAADYRRMRQGGPT